MFNDRNKLKERNLLLQIEAAKCRGQLAVGIQEVWNAAVEKKGKLLIAEKDILFPAQEAKVNHPVMATGYTQNNTLQDADVVYETIEKVLEDGGKIEFVENGRLRDYQQVVMIRY